MNFSCHLAIHFATKDWASSNSKGRVYMNTLFKIFLLFGVAWSHAKAGEITSLSKNLSDSKISNIKITALDDMPDYVTFSYCSTPPGENSPIPVYLSGGKAASLTSASEISKGNSCQKSIDFKEIVFRNRLEFEK